LSNVTLPGTGGRETDPPVGASMPTLIGWESDVGSLSATEAYVIEGGESVWPVVLGALLCLSVLGGTGFYLLRYGQAQAAARSARLLKWVAPVAVGVAALRLLVWWLGR